jgi:hypothetical protein
MDGIRSVLRRRAQHVGEMGQQAGGARRPATSILLGVIALLLATLLAASPALADDMFLASGALEAIGWMFIIWIGATLFVEAWILNAFLKLGYPEPGTPRPFGHGYLRALGYSVLANLASALLSLLWAGLFQEGGWKMALLSREWGILWRLLIRSYVVTTAEEGMVVALLVRNRRSIGTVFTAVAVANLVSYVLIAMIYLTITRG